MKVITSVSTKATFNSGEQGEDEGGGGGGQKLVSGCPVEIRRAYTRTYTIFASLCHDKLTDQAKLGT